MASYARRFISAGARLVGGCCGTTPEHTRQIVEAVRTARPAARQAPRAAVGVVGARPFAAARHRSARQIGAWRAHSPTDDSSSSSKSKRRAARIWPCRSRRRAGFAIVGAVAVNVPDYPKSGARATALALAALVEQSQVETMLQYVCRDRTLIGMQSDLVGAHAMGLRNVLLTTGGPARTSSHPDGGSTYEVDAIGLINMVASLNRGLDVGGQPLGTPTGFHIGAAINPFAADPESEWRRLAHKIEAGAEFLVTPPILDVEAFEPALARLRDTGLPIVAGIAALDGVRHAEFLASEVAGVRVADAVLERLRGASDESCRSARRHARNRATGWPAASRAFKLRRFTARPPRPNGSSNDLAPLVGGVVLLGAAGRE